MIPPAVGSRAGRRSGDLRLAHVHLRMGALELARAELESFAGRGILDGQALLDLAEARWRTGDLPGAGVAASAYLGNDDQEILALVIAAEAAAGVGHPGDARRLAQEALELLEVEARDRPEAPSGAEALDTLFAGMPQSQVWPLRPHFRVEPAGLLFVTPLVDRRQPAEGGSGMQEVGPGGTHHADAAAASSSAQPADDGETPGGASEAETAALEAGPGLWSEPASAPTPATPTPAELVDARAALDAGDDAVAATRLGDLLRRRPDLAASVLAALAEPGPDTAAPSTHPSQPQEHP